MWPASSVSCPSLRVLWGGENESASKDMAPGLFECLSGREPDGRDRHLPCAGLYARSLTGLV